MRSSRERLSALVPTEQSCQLVSLVDLFFSDISCLGEFVEINAQTMPDDERILLAHNRHMTATLEALHKSQILVEVLGTASDNDRYCRQVVLRRSSDRRAVQFAIVRIDFGHVDITIRREIEEQGAPLGRILIDHDVSRNVVMMALWQIKPAPELLQRLEIPALTTIYGRSAMIFCNGADAIELLEIPTPVRMM